MLKSGDSFTFVCPTIPSEFLQSNTYVFSFEIFVLWLAIRERDSWYIQLAPLPRCTKCFYDRNRSRRVPDFACFCINHHIVLIRLVLKQHVSRFSKSETCLRIIGCKYFYERTIWIFRCMTRKWLKAPIRVNHEFWICFQEKKSLESSWQTDY